MKQGFENLKDYIDSDEFKRVKEHESKKRLGKAAKSFYTEQLDKSIEQEIVAENLKNLKNDTIAAEKKDRYTRKKSEIDMRENLPQVGTKFLVLSVIASIVSVIMSCAGISEADTPSALLAAFSGRYCIYTWLMLLVQTAVIVYNLYSYQLKRFLFTKDAVINVFRCIIVATSMYYNYQFIILIIPESTETIFGTITAIILAAGPDFISNIFGSAAVDMKNKVYKENDGFLEDIKIILFGRLRNEIRLSAQKKREKYYPNYQKNVVSDAFALDNTYQEAVQLLIEQGARPGSTIRRGDIDYDRTAWRSFCNELKKKGFAKAENQSTIITRDLREYIAE